MKAKILLVDGYNMIAFWSETRPYFKKGDLDVARNILLNRLSNYASFEKLDVTVVFDATFVPGVRLRYDHYNVTVVFTEEGETADDYIEQLAAQLNEGKWTVSVATSDLNEQWTVFSQGALRIPAREMEERIAKTRRQVSQMSDNIQIYNPKLRPWREEQLALLQNLLDHWEE